ncbi:MAG: phosphoribosylamine--glycine ligase [SAR324 cluster bacterium]|nr:phosphoribosylamine--glycine ligase [SAR324 cluster bacterium]
MKVLIIGSGGREHSIAWKMRQSPRVTKVMVAPGNDGMRRHAELVPSLNSHEEILSFIKQEAIDLTFVGQEVYLVDGLVDQIEAAGCRAVGPTAAAAALEGSKAFSKDFMHRHHIPSAAYQTFSDQALALEYLKSLPAPYVIKADGLAAGKGAVICENLEDAQNTINRMLSGEAFGEAGKTIVIEEFLIGEEASYFVLTDGKDFVSFPSCQDHKRIGELDTGLNTGGMGAYSPAPVVTPAIENKIIEEVVRPTITGMAKEGKPYKGVLYVGLMVHEGNIKVVEFNCRFGDPECQPLMMRLKSDLFTLSLAVAEGTLTEQKIEFHKDSAVCIVLASEGYPQEYQKGKIISGIDASSSSDVEASEAKCCVFHAGTKLDGSVYRTNGGRVLGVTALGKNLETALVNAYQAVDQIYWQGVTYRNDIGAKGLLHVRDNRPEKSVGIVIGSKSDLEVAKKAMVLLERFGVGYELCIASAHRTPERTRHFVKELEAGGGEVFIAMAGMAAHLPGVIAAETTKPVIGVPVVSSLQGLDSLLAISQMPPGVPVATMATNGAANAAILAVQILALRYTDLRAQLMLYKMEMKQQVIASHHAAIVESS